MITMFQRITSLLLSLATLFSGLFGSGRAMMQNRAFDIALDTSTKEICDRIKAESDLDIEKMVTNLPDVNTPIKIVNTVFHIDTVAFRSKMYEIRDSYSQQHNDAMALLFYLIGAYFSGFERCDITLEPCGESQPNLYEFALNIYYVDGSEKLMTGAYYNAVTGEFFGNNQQGMANLGFDFNLNDMMVYAPINCWMRNFGFCLEYDLFCYTTPFFYYRTRRFKFDYAGKEWMIQIWKGKYLLANGAEVGVYNRDESKVGTYYDCASNDDLLKLSLDLYHGDELIFSRAEESHWWANGFKLMRNAYSADELTMKFTVEMKDAEMLQAFCKALDKNIYHDVTYSADGLKVMLTW
ncbi:MAG TPA: hypothetical protein DDY98_05500 [Ruminococcaceae bacterium]|nr:hypothetical protein [Oscillospiraceae bacterium]